MPSVFWAGSRDKKPVRMTVGVTLGDLVYELRLGPVPPLMDESRKCEHFPEGRTGFEMALA